jgi:hypothetical protein
MNLGLPSGGLRLRTFLSSGRSEVAGEAALPASIVLSPPWATGSRRATAGCRTASQSPIIGREEPTDYCRSAEGMDVGRWGGRIPSGRRVDGIDGVGLPGPARSGSRARRQPRGWEKQDELP